MSEGAQVLSESTVEVYADSFWQGTGIKLTKAEKAKITYVSGSWDISPSVCGCGPDGSGIYIAKDGYTMPGKPEGGLIGRVGSKIFWVGSHGETPDGAEGDLEFCTNDDLYGRFGGGFVDNGGSIIMKIELQLR